LGFYGLLASGAQAVKRGRWGVSMGLPCPARRRGVPGTATGPDCVLLVLAALIIAGPASGHAGSEAAERCKPWPLPEGPVEQRLDISLPSADATCMPHLPDERTFVLPASSMTTVHKSEARRAAWDLELHFFGVGTLPGVCLAAGGAQRHAWGGP
jgi:hypothetical protein